VLSPDVQSIGFEFYDGTQWVGSWDTTAAGQRRLPAAIRVSYKLTADPNTTHVFVVRLPLSDVTPNNPVSNGGTTSVPGGTTTGGVRPAPQQKRSLPPIPFGIGGTLPLFSNLEVVPDGSQDALTTAIQNPKSKIQNSEDPKSKIQNPVNEEWAITSDLNPHGKTALTVPISDPKSEIQNPKSKIQNLKPAGSTK